jgi:hypothetical protein
LAAFPSLVQNAPLYKKSSASLREMYYYTPSPALEFIMAILQQSLLFLFIAPKKNASVRLSQNVYSII